MSSATSSASPSPEAIPEATPAKIALPKTSESEQLKKIRHTTSHVLAMAVQKLFPKVQVTIGPWIETGFYYDFDSPEAFTEKDLKAIKKEMIKIINQKLPVLREEVSREEAQRRIQAQNEPYKLEILEGLSEPITLYHLGDKWWDLCAGPHVDSTADINPKAIELESVAGAYWRGDETKAQLQRIYGTAWESPEQLEAYLKQQEEAKRRDHRKLGQELDLFSIQEDAGGGLVFWHPKGAQIRYIIEEYWKQSHIQDGYQLLYTPHIANLNLWKTSGHFDFYRESMFDQMDVEEQAYQIKPMNCPFHVLTYKNTLHSYRELPIRWAELGTVYRYERSGTLHGLMRVRGFTQDDAHIFCLPEQIEAEILGVLNLTEHILSDFGFKDYEVNLSTRPEKSVGSDEIWEKATAGLVGALQRKGWKYAVDEGGGAFYGPKIDIKIEDAIGRMWQCSTIQLDFNLPERFELEYVASDSSRQQPIMIHRAIFGSLERFFGILIENYAGDFPIWLAPVQIRLLPVGDDFIPFAQQAVAQLKRAGLRAEVDLSGDRLGKLIRNAEKAKIPVMAVVGAKEVETATLSVRTRAGGELGAIALDEVQERLQRANAEQGAF
jgi:threonyl-tRNA synthetase